MRTRALDSVLKPTSAISALVLLAASACTTPAPTFLEPPEDPPAPIDVDKRLSVQLEIVQRSLAHYHRAYGAYPSTGGLWVGPSDSLQGTTILRLQDYIPGLAPEFLLRLPDNRNGLTPKGSLGFLYRSDGTDYKFLAHQLPIDVHSAGWLQDPADPYSWALYTPGARYWDVTSGSEVRSFLVISEDQPADPEAASASKA